MKLHREMFGRTSARPEHHRLDLIRRRFNLANCFRNVSRSSRLFLDAEICSIRACGHVGVTEPRMIRCSRWRCARDESL